MNAIGTISGSASAGTMVGGRCRIQIANVIAVDLRDGQSGSFSGVIEGNDKLDVDRFKTDPTPGVGASASGTIAVDNTSDTHACKVVFKPSGGSEQDLLTVAGGQSGTVAFTVVGHGDQMWLANA